MHALEKTQTPITPEVATRMALGVIIVKVAGRCDFVCDYCYEYTKPDQSWRERPAFMEEEVMTFTAHRAAQHAVDNRLNRLTIAFHGGEPFLAERSRPGYFARALEVFNNAREAWGWNGQFDFIIQTHGKYVTRELAENFYKMGIQIGVSLDGDKQANDLHRLDRRGDSTYQAGADALRLISEYPGLQATTLATMDLRVEALDTYKHLRSLGAKAIEFNMPHGTWTNLPPGYRGPLEPMGYGDQLCKVFDYWWTERDRASIPLFNEIVRLLLGKPGSLEYLGPFTPDVVTVRTDAGIDDVDIMSITANGRMNLGLNVFEDSFDAVLDHPKIRARQMGKLGLDEGCHICPALDICHGGYFPERYKEGSNQGKAFAELEEFMNRTVYCADLYQLIGHIARFMADLRGSVLAMMMSGGRGLHGIWRQLGERSKKQEADLYRSHREELARKVLDSQIEQARNKDRPPRKPAWQELPYPDNYELGQTGRAAAQEWLRQQEENRKHRQKFSRDRSLSNS